MRAFAAGCVIAAALLTTLTLAVPNTLPYPQCRGDLDNNGAVNFPGDVILLAKVSAGLATLPPGPPCNDYVPPSNVHVRVVGFADRPVPNGALATVCNDWMSEMELWFSEQANRTFGYDCDEFTSAHPITDMGPQDDCGQGLDTSTFEQLVEYDEMHLNEEGPFNNRWRNWFVIIGGGGIGHTSGIITNPPGDVGDNHMTAMAGDWMLNYSVTGVADPCCVTHNIYGPEACAQPGPSGAISQEAVNSMGVGYYNTDTGVFYPGSFTQAAIDAFHDPFNAPWLH